MRSPTAVIADDHPLIREAVLQVLTAAGVDVVAQAQDGLEAIALVRALQPSLIVLDIAMPHARGIDVMAEARRWAPNTKVIVFSGMTSAGLFRALLDAKADGVFVKRGAMSEFADAVPRILAGEHIVAPEVQVYLDQSSAGAPLTLREHQVLSLLAQGFGNKAIAQRLGVAAKTVDNHRTNLMRKLGVHTFAELLSHAIREGLLEADQSL